MGCKCSYELAITSLNFQASPMILRVESQERQQSRRWSPFRLLRGLESQSLACRDQGRGCTSQTPMPHLFLPTVLRGLPGS